MPLPVALPGGRLRSVVGRAKEVWGGSGGVTTVARGTTSRTTQGPSSYPPAAVVHLFTVVRPSMVPGQRRCRRCGTEALSVDGFSVSAVWSAAVLRVESQSLQWTVWRAGTRPTPDTRVAHGQHRMVDGEMRGSWGFETVQWQSSNEMLRRQCPMVLNHPQVQRDRQPWHMTGDRVSDVTDHRGVLQYHSERHLLF